MNLGKRIKIRDLAIKVGVSVTSVSRALNGHSNISDTTKNKIFKAAQKYNYFPNLNAKRLASQKADTIAFIATINPNAHDYVLMEFLAGLTLGVKDTPTELIVKFITDKKEELNYYKKLIEVNVADKFVFYQTKKMIKELIF